LSIEKEAFGRRAWSADLFRQYAAECPDLFLVAKVGSAIAAYSITSTRENRAELDSIAVARRFQNQGVGSAFLRFVVRKLHKAGFATLSLMVRRDNHAAIRSYRSLGFRRIRTVPFYYEGGETAWRMQLVLG
jgi:ribosomal-protein-alanine N-acetyltransferase